MTQSLRNAPRALKDAAYPTYPSWWPNRAVRRAVKQRRESRLPAPWVAFLAVNPQLRKTIRAL